jgi:hypothetical protein
MIVRDIQFVLIVPIAWFLGAGICGLTCKFRGIRVTLLQCLIIAGLPLALGAVPLSLPYFLQVALGFGLMVYVMMTYLGVDLFPNGLLISTVTRLSEAGVLIALEALVKR